MIRLTIPGRPRAKQRPRIGYRGRRAYMYTPEETAAYEELVGFVARTHCRRPLDGLLEVRITVYFRDDATPDLDNVIKAILDGMNRVAFGDDRQVKRIVAETKRAAGAWEERAEVEIRPLEGAAG